jgi:uroporphyrin-III C-methyltransferase
VLGALAPGAATVVVLMGMGTRLAIARFLIGAGWSEATPAAVIVNASQPHQRVWTGRLATLGSDEDADRREEPGVIVIGEVVTAAVMPYDVAGFLAEEQQWQPTTIRQP